MGSLAWTRSLVAALGLSVVLLGECSAAAGRDRPVAGAWRATPIEASDNTWTAAINDRGQLVGWSESASTGEVRGFLWRRGALTDLGRGRPAAINDYGQIVGTRESGGGRAFLWQMGRIRDLGSLPGKAQSAAVAINNRGQVIGNAFAELRNLVEVFPRAFLWQSGKMIDLGTLGGRSSSAIAINDHGQVVGWSETKSGTRHAFLWEKGRMRDLGTLPGKRYSEAVALNDRGQVVGNSYTRLGGSWEELAPRAFLWKNGKLVALDSSLGASTSTAVAINNQGQIIGGTTFETLRYQPTRAFIWQNGHATYLSLPKWSWVDRSAVQAINERGQIVGWVGTVGATEAAIWQNGKRTDLPSPGGMGHDEEVSAKAINDHDEIIGGRSATMSFTTGIVWTRGP